MNDTQTIGDNVSFVESLSQPQPVDYFGFQSSERFFLPDGLSYIEFDVMNEGKRLAFQKSTGRDIVLQRSGDARMRMDPGTERHELIRQSVTGWNLSRGGQLVPFNRVHLEDFLKLADPKIIEKLEMAIRKANPWLLGELTADEIQKQIEELQEMKQVALEREAGESSSSSK